MQLTVPVLSRFTSPIRHVQVAQFDAGAHGAERTLKGTAIVFDVLSDDLGGFKTTFKRGAARAALSGDPPIHALWGHDDRLVVGYTRNQTLKLAETTTGVEVLVDVARVSYGDDLLELVRRGDLAEMSFACTIDADEWSIGPDGDPLRTVSRLGEIYEVSFCTRGAFPQTSATLTRTVHVPDAPVDAQAAAAAARERMRTLTAA